MNIRKHLSQRNTLFITRSILGEDILEFLRDEAAFVIVRSGVWAMFVFVDPCYVDAEEGIWEPAWEGGIAEVGVDD